MFLTLTNALADEVTRRKRLQPRAPRGDAAQQANPQQATLGESETHDTSQSC